MHLPPESLQQTSLLRRGGKRRGILSINYNLWLFAFQCWIKWILPVHFGDDFVRFFIKEVGVLIIFNLEAELGLKIMNIDSVFRQIFILQQTKAFLKNFKGKSDFSLIKGANGLFFQFLEFFDEDEPCWKFIVDVEGNLFEGGLLKLIAIWFGILWVGINEVLDSFFLVGSLPWRHFVWHVR